MVVGGFPPSANAKSELYDLSGQNLTCPSVADFPYYTGSVGTFINNKAMVCGGYQNDTGYWPSNLCYSYIMQVLEFIINFLIADLKM